MISRLLEQLKRLLSKKKHSKSKSRSEANQRKLNVEPMEERVLLAADFGDAPDPPYATLAANNGASHEVIPGGPRLGPTVDTEPNGLPGGSALGDDFVGIDDEDGVTFGVLTPGQPATMDISVTVADGRVDAWIDFDHDGVFEAKVVNNSLVPAGTTQTFGFNVPANARAGTTYARIRVSSAGNLPAVGPAADGEVEDYRIVIQGTDYGDAPDPPYDTLTIAQATPGPSHPLTATSPILGFSVDGDIDGQPDATATGDDGDGNDDEDGVVIGDLFRNQNGAATITVTNADGFVDAWIDFNQNGQFESSEYVIQQQLVAVNNSQPFTFGIPATAILGDTIARFRVSSVAIGTPNGPAVDGEVEDYQVTVLDSLDFGDAPDPSIGVGVGNYNTTAADDGARHVIGGPVLGTLVDVERDALPELAADGDDNDNLNDEDGVVFTDLFPLDPLATMAIGRTATMNVQVTGADGRVDAWIDFDHDGIFETKVINDQPVIANTISPFSFVVPGTAAEGLTYARVRVSSGGNLAPTGPAPDGEVEDYLIELLNFDFGDAPDPLFGTAQNDYQTTLIDGGPQHAIRGPRLGALVDQEIDAAPSADAQGDDTAGTDDEDGVSFTQLLIGQNATAGVTVEQADGFVDAWVDFNRNGAFEPAEQIITNQAMTAQTTQNFTFAVPFATSDPGDTIARFRVSSAGNLGPAGIALDGEVEDYLVTLNAVDYGDLQDPAVGTTVNDYQTTFADNGPRHIIGGPRLGKLIDHEDGNGPFATNTADFDDNSSVLNDEDGVVFGELIAAGPNAIATVEVTAADGRVDAWVDFDNDGNFNQNEEYIIRSQLVTAATVQNFSFAVPSSANLGTNFARVRVSSAGNLTSTGQAPDGEVEDYRVVIKAYDYGDAPVETTARHQIGGPFLGAEAPDPEAGSLANAAADGDDVLDTGSADDEDGVTFSSGLTIPGVSTLVPGRTDNFADVTVNGPAGVTEGRLHVWIDLDGDGDFGGFDIDENGTVDADELGNEKIVSDLVMATGAGVVQVPLDIPLTANADSFADNGGFTYARFRIISASDPGLTASETANDGEVEDYRVRIVPLDFGDVSLGSGSGTVYAIQPATQSIVVVDTAGGGILSSYPAPDNLQPTHTNLGLSLAEQGAVLLYVNSDDNTNDLYRLDAATGAVLSIETLNSETKDSIGYEFDAATGEHLIFPGPSDMHKQIGYSTTEIFFWTPTGPDAIGADGFGRSFMFDGNMINEYDVVNASAPYFNSFNPPPGSTQLEGMAFNGVHIIASDDAGQLYTLDPDTGAVICQTTVAGGALYGLGARTSNTSGCAVDEPSHSVQFSGPILGSVDPDNEPDVQPSINADADDPRRESQPTLALFGTTVPAGTGSAAVAVADFNRDLIDDLAITNITSNDVTIQLGEGNGTFNAATGSPIAVGTNPVAIVAEDFNNDGIADLAVGNRNSDNLTILIGNGDGTFTTIAQQPGVGGSPRSMTAGDFNEDGIMDLAVANFTDNDVTILLGDDDGSGRGDGTFTAGTDVAVGTDPRAIVTGDFNGDNHLDLAVANNGSDSVSILIGAGNGSFAQFGNAVVGDGPFSLAVGDLNGDTAVDLAVANRTSNNVTILLSNSNGTFTQGINSPFNVGSDPESLVATDLNHDGILDLAVVNNNGGNPGSVTILQGTGNAQYAEAITAPSNSPIGVGDSPVFIATGSFDRGGGPDLVVVNQDDGNLSLILGPDEEDGLIFNPGSVNEGRLLSGTTNQISVTVGARNPTGRTDIEGYVHLWLDANRDGIFSLEEKLLDNFLIDADVGGTVVATADVRQENFGRTYARVRVVANSTPGLSPSGFVETGEIEDHAVVIIGSDFGDAPTGGTVVDGVARNYGTAEHFIAGPRLGGLVDAEAAALSSVDALGDDVSDQLDDEDGVNFAELIFGQTTTANISVRNFDDPSAAAYISAWIDFNNDGDFSDPGERILGNDTDGDGAIDDAVVTTPDGSAIDYSFDMPSDIAAYGAQGPNGNRFARVRVRNSHLPFTANAVATDGEAEDYVVTLAGGLDFGDAVDSRLGTDGPGIGGFFDYQTRSVDGGPSHLVTATSVRMGSVDIEVDGQPNPASDGDDMNTIQGVADDEDGVALSGFLGAGQVLAGQTDATLTITASAAVAGTAYVQAWADFDQDGTFLGANERIALTSVAVGPTNVVRTIPFTVPAGALAGQTQVRVRISGIDPGANAWGPVGGTAANGTRLDGEVEDHLVQVFTHDFGDASASLEGPDPARHIANPGDVILGSQRDSEGAAQSGNAADGDDTNGVDDEDGVRIFNDMGAESIFLTAGFGASLTVDVTDPGSLADAEDARLFAWADFNGDGNFNPITESIVNGLALDSTTSFQTFSNINFNVPTNAVIGDSTIRVRLVNPNDPRFDDNDPIFDATVLPTGLEPNGEVEDYRITIRGRDFGDLPANFPQATRDAYHIAFGPQLGAARDTEPGGQDSADATGDDNLNTGVDDEDGVSFNSLLGTGLATFSGFYSLVPGRVDNQIVVDVTGGTGITEGYVHAWVDLDNSGSFDATNSFGADEKVIDDLRVDVSAGQVSVNVDIPVGSFGDVNNDNLTFARVRVVGGSTPNLSPNDIATEGEVEDYQVALVPLDFGDAPLSTQSGFSGSYPSFRGDTAPVGFLGMPARTDLITPGQFLSGPSGLAPLDNALNFLTNNVQLIGLSQADLTNFRVSDQYASSHNGVTHIHLQQTLNGLDVLNSKININVAAGGEIINVGSNFLANLDPLESVTPSVTAIQAVNNLAGHFGLNIGATPQELSKDQGVSQRTMISASGISLEDIPAELHYVPDGNGGVELAWKVNIQTLDNQHWYDASVSAVDGDFLITADWVANATYNVFHYNLENPDDGGRTQEIDPQVASASPFGWHDINGAPGAEFTDTRGNNVFAQEDANADNMGGARPDGGAPLVFDFPLDLTMAPAAYLDAATTNLFYMNNILHDIHYQYGFDEAAGNFQENNYGNGGLGGDGVRADAQDGSGFNNANFATPPDGTPGRMQQFIFNITNPFRDSDLSNAIIVHEYGHGVSNRLTGGPADSFALQAVQSRGMGEGWSDFHSLMFNQKATDAQADSYPVGTYVLGQPQNGAGIRTFPYSFDMTVNPLTYDDGNARFPVGSPHAEGEIWATTLWDMNWLLINGNGGTIQGQGFDPDLYNGNGGNNLALQLVMDGMKLQPANPSFLDARDGILQADTVLTGGQNHCAIWTAFARRGMGISADDGGSGNATAVVAAFDVPPTACQTIFVSNADSAHHSIDGSGPHLGVNSPDAEPNGQPTANADGDDPYQGANFPFRHRPAITAGVANPTALAIGDINADGYQDFAVGQNGSGVLVYLNNRTADPFAGVNGVDVTSDTDNTTSIELVDVDGDSDLDLITGNANQTNKLFLNNGFGVFTAAGDIAASTDDTRSVTSTDVDADGDADLIVGNFGQNNKLYINDGEGVFTESNLGAQTDNTQSVITADVDGDGDADVITGNNGQTNKLYRNNGNGTFAAAVDITADAHATSSLAVADIDGDGDTDLVVGNATQNRLYLNNGNGTFAAGVNIGTDVDNTLAVAIGDVDADGDLDVVAGNSFVVNKLYRNNGDGTFNAAAGTDVSNGEIDSTAALLLGDFNSGGPDILEANSAPADINIRLSDDEEDGLRVNRGTTNEGIVTAGLDNDFEITVATDNAQAINAATAITGFVHMWIDMNRDGDWDDVGEKILDDVAFNNVQHSTAGGPVTQTFTVSIPDTLIDDTYARIRVVGESTPGMLPGGFIATGEVEDFRLSVVAYDYGDAPDVSAGQGANDYQTLAANGGPRHSLGGPRLGTEIDVENDGQPTSDAFGDDVGGVDDEDGVVVTPLFAGLPSTATVTVTGEDGQVDGWIDFNGDGDFTDPGEKIIDNETIVAATPADFTFTVPSGAIVGSTFARYRVSRSGNLTPNGAAADSDGGEVEDYLVGIGALDFGDAPDTSAANGTGNYDTLLSNDGPRHLIGGPILGSRIDLETDGQPNSLANGDDNNGGTDDEEGVTFGAMFAGSGSTMGVTVSGAAGQVDAWIDFNANGVFEATEQIVTGGAVPFQTSRSFSFAVPPTAVQGSTYARVRVSSAGGLTPTGLAPDGEVEDYVVSIGSLDFGDAPSGNVTNGGFETGALAPWTSINFGPDGTSGPVAVVPFDTIPFFNSPAAQLQVGKTANIGAPAAGGALIQNTNLFQGNITISVDIAAFSAAANPEAGIFRLLFDGAVVDTVDLGPLTANFTNRGTLTANIPNVASGNHQIRIDVQRTLAPGPTQYIDNVQITGSGFGTLLSNNGPRHIAGGPRLGVFLDTETDGQPTTDALGDDNNGTPDDEDGVVFGQLLAGANGTAAITVTGANGLVDAWIDFNGDADFDDQNEQIILSQNVNAGTVQSFNFPIPANAVIGTTYGRVRVSSAGGLSPFGLAIDGEVEDYRISVQGTDFGDLPDVYNTTSGNNGAFHAIGGPQLGRLRDSEANGTPTNDASGDDLNGAVAVGADVLLVDDANGGFGDLANLLTGQGHTVTEITGEFANNYTNLLNTGFLQSFDFVIYAERGNGTGAVLPTNVTTSLGAYTSGGGHLLVTGYDSLGGPVDNNVAGLVRALNPADQISFDPNWQTPNALASGQFILNGSYGDFRNLAFANVGYNDDVLAPDTAAGAIEIASAPNQSSRIIYTDLSGGGGGSVGFWNGGLSNVNANAQPDFTDGGVLQNILLNWIEGATNSTPSDDEDGVTFANLVAGRTDAFANVNVTGQSGRVDAWIDFNQNNAFEPNEKIINSVLVAGGTTQPLNFDVPSGAILGDTYARVRVSIGGNLGPAGQAFDGEVEDYQVTIRGLDFGDAPDISVNNGLGDYDTLFVNHGPAHILGGPRLGALVDQEPDGLASSNAAGDDGNNASDEDGVAFTSSLINGLNATVNVNVQGQDGHVDAWVDFDRDGLFEPTEQIIQSQLVFAGTPRSFAYAVPADASLGTTFARFRVSREGGLTPTGLAIDGEVEDYQIAVIEQLLDFGDAPDPAIGTASRNYNTTLADDGPRHVLTAAPAVFLGNNVDNEANGLQSTSASGDDQSGSPDDEDGLVAPFVDLEVTQNVSPSVDVVVTNTSGFAANLYGWIDYNGDGVFNNATERATIGVPNGTNAQTVTLNFPAVTGGFVGSSFARFRISTSAAAQNPTGLALDGEVEDYPVLVRAAGLDYGDAPDTGIGTSLGNYQTLSIDDGARHQVGGPILGPTVDVETFAAPTPSAHGDDSVNTDDEDGVEFTTPLRPGNSATVEVTVAGAAGVLNAWVDFNRDGDWSDIGEQIFVEQPVVVGVNTLNFNVPANAVQTDTFARFRIDTVANRAGTPGGSISTGLALDGEVEDYRVIVGRDSLGIYRAGQFFQDVNDNGTYDGPAGGDTTSNFGGPGDVVIIGDWDGDGTDNIGIYRTAAANPAFFLDLNNNGVFDGAPTDRVIFYGAQGDQPVTGDWNGDGTDDIGVKRGSEVFLDANGNGVYDGGDVRTFFGAATDLPIAGDWDNDGRDEIGALRLSTGAWYLDSNGNNLYDGQDLVRNFGGLGDKPAIGDHNGDGTDDIGVYRNGVFMLDSNGNGIFDGGDAQIGLGMAGDDPAIGNWALPSPQLAAAGEIVNSNAGVLSEEDLTPIVSAAVDLLASAGLSNAQLESLQQVDVRIADLGGAQLGQALRGVITIDANAAGHGWFVDATPDENEEFTLQSGQLLLTAGESQQMDLLSVVLHELGHVLGLEDKYGDSDSNNMMSGWLNNGTRRLPTDGELAAILFHDT